MFDKDVLREKLHSQALADLAVEIFEKLSADPFRAEIVEHYVNLLSDDRVPVLVHLVKIEKDTETQADREDQLVDQKIVITRKFATKTKELFRELGFTDLRQIKRYISNKYFVGGYLDMGNEFGIGGRKSVIANISHGDLGWAARGILSRYSAIITDAANRMRSYRDADQLIEAKDFLYLPLLVFEDELAERIFIGSQYDVLVREDELLLISRSRTDYVTRFGIGGLIAFTKTLMNAANIAVKADLLVEKDKDGINYAGNADFRELVRFVANTKTVGVFDGGGDYGTCVLFPSVYNPTKIITKELETLSIPPHIVDQLREEVVVAVAPHDVWLYKTDGNRFRHFHSFYDHDCLGDLEFDDISYNKYGIAYLIAFGKQHMASLQTINTNSLAQESALGWNAYDIVNEAKNYDWDEVDNSTSEVVTENTSTHTDVTTLTENPVIDLSTILDVEE